MSTITKLNPSVRLQRTERRTAVRIAQESANILSRMGKVMAAISAAATAEYLNKVRKAPNLTGLQKQAIFSVAARDYLQEAA